jgi:hypothetical protein
MPIAGGACGVGVGGGAPGMAGGAAGTGAGGDAEGLDAGGAAEAGEGAAPGAAVDGVEGWPERAGVPHVVSGVFLRLERTWSNCAFIRVNAASRITRSASSQSPTWRKVLADSKTDSGARAGRGCDPDAPVSVGEPHAAINQAHAQPAVMVTDPVFARRSCTAFIVTSSE